MLRFVRESDDDHWRPAAGTLRWPKEPRHHHARPCCGSGHFLTQALAIFTALRANRGRLVACRCRRRRAAGKSARIRARRALRPDRRLCCTRSRLGALVAGRFCRCRISPGWARRRRCRNGSLWRWLRVTRTRNTVWPLCYEAVRPSTTLGSLIEPQRWRLLVITGVWAKLRYLLDKLLTKAKRAEPEQAEGAIAAREVWPMRQPSYRALHASGDECTDILGRGKQDASVS